MEEENRKIMRLLKVNLLSLLDADHIYSFTSIRQFDVCVKTILYLGFCCAGLPLTFPLKDVLLQDFT